MRSVKLSDGEERLIEPLTGKQVEKFFDIEKKRRAEDGYEPFAILKAAGLYTNEKILNLPYPDLRKLQDEISAETFGSAEEQKN